MNEIFSVEASGVQYAANQAARDLCHEYVGTEHVLLGIINSKESIAFCILARMCNLDDLKSNVLALIQKGEKSLTSIGKLPNTPRAKKVFEYAHKAMKDEQDSTRRHPEELRSDHLLIGLIKEQEGVASQVLMNLIGTKDDILSKIIFHAKEFLPLSNNAASLEKIDKVVDNLNIVWHFELILLRHGWTSDKVNALMKWVGKDVDRAKWILSLFKDNPSKRLVNELSSPQVQFAEIMSQALSSDKALKESLGYISDGLFYDLSQKSLDVLDIITTLPN